MSFASLSGARMPHVPVSPPPPPGGDVVELFRLQLSGAGVAQTNAAAEIQWATYQALHPSWHVPPTAMVGSPVAGQSAALDLGMALQDTPTGGTLGQIVPGVYAAGSSFGQPSGVVFTRDDGWTLEWLVYLTPNADNFYPWITGFSTGAQGTFDLHLEMIVATGGGMRIIARSFTGRVDSTFTVPTGRYVHFALVDTANDLSLYADGVLVTTVLEDGPLSFAGEPLGSFEIYGAQSFSGPTLTGGMFLGGLALSSGVKYTGAFTPPTSL